MQSRPNPHLVFVKSGYIQFEPSSLIKHSYFCLSFAPWLEVDSSSKEDYRVQMGAGYKSGSRVQMGLGWSRVQMGLGLCRVQMGIGAGSRFRLV